jgi:hypothetical protein
MLVIVVRVHFARGLACSDVGAVVCALWAVREKVLALTTDTVEYTNAMFDQGKKILVEGK